MRKRIIYDIVVVSLPVVFIGAVLLAPACAYLIDQGFADTYWGYVAGLLTTIGLLVSTFGALIYIVGALAWLSDNWRWRRNQGRIAKVDFND